MSAYTHRLYGRIVSAPARLPAPEAHGVPDVTLLAAPVPRLPHDPSSIDPYTYVALPDGSICVNWSDRVWFCVSTDGKTVSYDVARPADALLVFDYLLAQILSVALLQQNVESLHATALEIDGQAIALVGDSGHGKSTLAGALIQRGARLLTDDLLVLDEQQRVLPGAQRIKLTSEAARTTIGERSSVYFGDAHGKASYALAESEFQHEPMQLARIYLLRTGEAEIAAMPEAEIFRELLAATFNPLDTTAVRLTRHMSFTKRLAEGTAVQTLRVPWDLARLEEACSLLRAAEKERAPVS